MHVASVVAMHGFVEDFRERHIRHPLALMHDMAGAQRVEDDARGAFRQLGDGAREEVRDSPRLPVHRNMPRRGEKHLQKWRRAIIFFGMKALSHNGIRVDTRTDTHAFE